MCNVLCTKWQNTEHISRSLYNDVHVSIYIISKSQLSFSRLYIYKPLQIQNTYTIHNNEHFTVHKNGSCSDLYIKPKQQIDQIKRTIVYRIKTSYSIKHWTQFDHISVYRRIRCLYVARRDKHEKIHQIIAIFILRYLRIW